jgi:GNAT superfamily N-acetyltransferase
VRAEPEMRQLERAAGQGWRADVPPAAGGSIHIRELSGSDAERIGDRLPLARLGRHQTYFVAWDGGDPVGHAHVAWTGTTIGVPEIQDVFVRPEHRRRGIATELTLRAERAAAERGHTLISLSYGIANDAARTLYERAGFRSAGLDPQRVRGTVMLRNGPLEVDDTLIYLVKDL